MYTELDEFLEVLLILIPIDGIDQLPGLKWKSLNIEKMDTEKQKIALDKLKKVLEL